MSDSLENFRPLKPIKWYKTLASIKGRLESGAFLLEGEKAIRQVIDSFPDSVVEVVTVEDTAYEFHHFPVRILTEQQFNSVSLTKTPQGIMAVVRFPQETYSDQLPMNTGSRVLLLEGIQDPGNVGTLIRTAVAFGFDGIVLSQKCADPFSPKCVQSTAGTVLSVWLRRNANYIDLAQEFKHRGYSLLVADVGGKGNTKQLEAHNRLILALCNEAGGPSKELLNIADHLVTIPINRHKAESLNVAVCGAICMYLSSTECNDSAADLE